MHAHIHELAIQDAAGHLSQSRTHELQTVIQASRQFTVNPIKLETGLRPNSAGIPYILLLRIEAMGFPTFGLLL